MLDGNTARISAKSNAFTDAVTTWEYALLKAAETTQERGFDYFAVVDAASGMKRTTTMGYNAYGNPTLMSNSKPRTNFIIDMYNGCIPSSAPAGVFSAPEVITYLGPKYRK